MATHTPTSRRSGRIFQFPSSHSSSKEDIVSELRRKFVTDLPTNNKLGISLYFKFGNPTMLMTRIKGDHTKLGLTLSELEPIVSKLVDYRQEVLSFKSPNGRLNNLEFVWNCSAITTLGGIFILVLYAVGALPALAAIKMAGVVMAGGCLFTCVLISVIVFCIFPNIEKCLNPAVSKVQLYEQELNQSLERRSLVVRIHISTFSMRIYPRTRPPPAEPLGNIPTAMSYQDD